jgi:cobalt-zinc-cadmium efflux system membrane fusion protein
MSRTSKIAVAVVALLVVLVVGGRVWANVSAPAVRVEAGEIREAFVARAEVVPAGGVTHVTARVAGRVTRVDVRVGDRVEAGQQLAAIEPSERGPNFDLLGEDEALESPIAGVVLARHIEPGDTLNTIVPPPLPLFELADPSRLELRIEIEERDVERVSLGQRARVGEREIEITRLAPRIERRAHPLDDVASRARGDVRVAWTALPDPDGLVIGQHVEVALHERPRAVRALVPREAVEVVLGRAILRVRDGLFVNETPVTLGACDDENVEVDGVATGTEVLVRAR